MLDHQICYRALSSRDARFDGVFFVGVTSTGIYCRPSCPAKTPKRDNVRFFATAAAAQREGLRACKRCRPDTSPGSPEWNGRADVAGRAMRLILDGVVDRDGVEGLARRLGYSPRQLHRVLVTELGAGPIALARAQRAQAARVLLQTTDLPIAQVAFAAGFGSVRQFNATIGQVFAQTPSGLRAGAARWTASIQRAGGLRLRLPYRKPIAFGYLLAFLGERCIPGVEAVENGVYMRTLSLPHGLGTLAVREVEEDAGYLACDLELEDHRDVQVAVERVRRLLDLDADPSEVQASLGSDRLLGASVAALPGLRLPGAFDGAEMAMRAVLGQQVSVAAARTAAGRLAERYGAALPHPRGPLVRAFPTAERLAALDPAELNLPRGRAQALVTLARALAERRFCLDPGADREDVSRRLLSLRGIGSWTVQYLRMRALGDPDAFLVTDLGVRRALEGLGQAGDPKSADAIAQRWRPWRSYAVQYLWAGSALREHGATDDSDMAERGWTT
jgi:AraC family transcriptional regulator of adaptative response / DNA-3-methyladenine glycosylase II